MSDAVIFDRYDIEEMIKDYVRSNLKIRIEVRLERHDIKISIDDGYTEIDYAFIEKDDLKNFIAD